MQEEELFLPEQQEQRRPPIAAPSHPAAQPGHSRSSLGWGGASGVPLMSWGGLPGQGPPFAAAGVRAAVPHTASRRRLGRYVLVVAVRGCTRCNRPCSPGQVCCRGASQGGVKFGLLDILEPPPGDNDRNLDLGPSVVANSAKKRCSTFHRQDFP